MYSTNVCINHTLAYRSVSTLTLETAKLQCSLNIGTQGVQELFFVT